MDKKLSTGIQVLLGFLLGLALNVAVIWIGFLISFQLPYNATLDRIGSYGLVLIGVSGRSLPLCYSGAEGTKDSL